MATVADVSAIVSVLIATKEACFAPPLSDRDRDVAFCEDRWRRYISQGSTAQMACGDGFTFVAEKEGQVVGFAAYHHTRRHNTHAELQAIYVKQAAQSQGIGTALLHLIASRLAGEGSASMCVGYSCENPYKRFYFKHGAVEINPYWAVWHDVSKLLARLGEDSSGRPTANS
jgi:GNAT superfamily N-acetyltransferase